MTSSSRVARARSVLAALLAAAAGWMLGVAAWAAWFGVALARDNALSAREALAAVGVTWGVYLVAALPGLLAALVFLAPGLGRVSSRRAAGAGLAGSVAAVVVLNLLFRR